MRRLRIAPLVFALGACSARPLVLEPEAIDLRVERRDGRVSVSGAQLLQIPGRFVWGSSVVRGRDGRYHMLFNTWSVGADTPRFTDAWVLCSEIGYAVSEHPDRGFRFRGIALRPRAAEGHPDAWDAQMVTNPHVRRFGDSFYLYYVGSRDPGPQDAGSPGARLSRRNRVQQMQRIGVVRFGSFDDLVAGRIERPDNPLLPPRTRVKARDVVDPSPPGTRALPDNLITVNPSVVFRPEDGKYLLYFKGNWYQPHWTGVHGVAIGDSPAGPFRPMDEVVFRVDLADGRIASAEDPFVWHDPRRGAFFAVVKDFTGALTGGPEGLALLRSPDGMAWRPAQHPLFTKKELPTRTQGRVAVARLERPSFLLSPEGAPTVFYAACSIGPCNDARDGRTFNVHVPLRR